VKSSAGGTRKLLSAQHEFEKYLFDRLLQPIYTERAAILRHPAFQAGCRGFEPRLPLLPLLLFLLKVLLRLIPKHILFLNVSMMWLTLEHSIYNLDQVDSMMMYYPGNLS
jgi:hypothetical protein